MRDGPVGELQWLSAAEATSSGNSASALASPARRASSSIVALSMSTPTLDWRGVSIAPAGESMEAAAACRFASWNRTGPKALTLIGGGDGAWRQITR